MTEVSTLVTITSVADRTNATRDDIFVFQDYTQRAIIAAILGVVFLIGVPGNTLVILSVAMSRRLRSPTNWFVINLALADILTNFCLPFNMVSMLSRTGWPLPGWVCAVVAGVTLSCLGASIITLAMIAYNRWYLLAQTTARFQKLYTRRNITIMVLVTWVYPLILIIVPMLAGLGRLGYSMKYKTCTQDTSGPNAEEYGLVAGVGVAIPASLVIVIMYTRIYLFVTRHRTKMELMRTKGPSSSVAVQGQCYTHHGSANDIAKGSEILSSGHLCTESMKEESVAAGRYNFDMVASASSAYEGPKTSVRSIAGSISQNQTTTNSGHQPMQTRLPWNQKHVTLTKRLALVVIAFFICFLPATLAVLVSTSDPFLPWASIIATCNSCVNPLIYARTIPAFRKVMGCIVRCRLHEIPEPVQFIRRN